MIFESHPYLNHPCTSKHTLPAYQSPNTTHARPSLPVNPDPNPTRPKLAVVKQHDTAALFEQVSFLALWSLYLSAFKFQIDFFSAKKQEMMVHLRRLHLQQETIQVNTSWKSQFQKHNVLFAEHSVSSVQ